MEGIAGEKENSPTNDCLRNGVLTQSQTADEKLKSQLDDLSEEIISKVEDINFDFVFYPFLSAVSVLELEIKEIIKYSKIGSNVEVYPIPRIMTPKGWRFTFPPKFLNEKTKNSDILILDDGSCTGDTMIQMIDTLGFLKVKSMTVLSIFGRLEDYSREFLTRIHEIQVRGNRIPIKIYLGTNLNIPVYNKSNHPYAAELDEIQSYKHVPVSAARHIDRRVDQIGKSIEGFDGNENLIPSFVSRKMMFHIRDYLGKFDSYRLYKEDDPFESFDGDRPASSAEYFNKIIETKEGFDALIAVLNHEPKLIGTLNNVLPELIRSLSKTLRIYFSSHLDLVERDWIFYLRITSFINIELLLDVDLVFQVFKRIEHNEQLSDASSFKRVLPVFDYFSFILFCIHQNKIITSKRIDREQLQVKLGAFVERLATKALLELPEPHPFGHLFKEFVEEYRIPIPRKKDHPAFVDAYAYFKDHFFDDLGRISHPILFSRFQEFYIEFYNAIDIGGKERALTEYKSELKKIYEEVIPKAKVILDSIKAFKSYVHDFDIQALYALIVGVRGIIHDLLDNHSSNKVIVDSGGNLSSYDLLQELNNSIIAPTSEFQKFAKDFGFNLPEMANELLKKTTLEITLQRSLVNLALEVEENFPSTILSHPIYFQIFLREVVQNVCKHASGAACELRFFVLDEDVIIRFSQDMPKKAEYIGEKGIRDLRKLASMHGGSFHETDMLRYTFDFKIPITIFR